jgi:hypothetical protein
MVNTTVSYLVRISAGRPAMRTEVSVVFLRSFRQMLE